MCSAGMKDCSRRYGLLFTLEFCERKTLFRLEKKNLTQLKFPSRTQPKKEDNQRGPLVSERGRELSGVDCE